MSKDGWKLKNNLNTAGRHQYLSHSAIETFELGRQLGEILPVPSVVCFFGELGAGKTTFIKGLVCGAAQLDPAVVQSPTFTYLHIYEGTQRIFHFDLYRLRDIDEFLSMGFDEYFEEAGICCMEWSEKIESYLPADRIVVTLEHREKDHRLITIEFKDVESKVHKNSNFT